MSMPYAINQGIRIHYQVEGSGPPLVLQHGFFWSVEGWYRVGYVDALRTSYRLILVDARGHGASDKPHDDAAYSLPQHVADIVAVLDALYLPKETSFTLDSHTDVCEVAYGWCETDEDHPPKLITPNQVKVEIRGGGNATRQINSIIPPGFDCHRLVVVEVYTPSGNWSSYPPHKHDEHILDRDGNLVEADLEEIYFYKIDREEGYAIQRIYTRDRRIDETITVASDDLVLVPEGYHPVVSAHGYTTYYLNVLAGSAQSLANSDDPEFAWIKDTWTIKDARLPLVTLEMEQR